VNANFATANSLYAWAQQKSATAYFVDYKLTDFTYSFRQAPSTVNQITGQGWQVYPNPAANTLTVNNAAAANAAARYQIIDMAGRAALNGSLQSITNIDVSLLAPGVYIIKMYNDYGVRGQAVFVKE
jgi:hypothetical protein